MLSNFKFVCFMLALIGFAGFMVDKYVDHKVEEAVKAERVAIGEAHKKELEDLRKSNKALLDSIAKREKEVKESFDIVKKESDDRFKDLEEEWKNAEGNCEKRLEVVDDAVDVIANRLFGNGVVTPGAESGKGDTSPTSGNPDDESVISIRSLGIEWGEISPGEAEPD